MLYVCNVKKEKKIVKGKRQKRIYLTQDLNDTRINDIRRSYDKKEHYTMSTKRNIFQYTGEYE